MKYFLALCLLAVGCEDRPVAAKDLLPDAAVKNAVSPTPFDQCAVVVRQLIGKLNETSNSLNECTQYERICFQQLKQYLKGK